jgi:hypothetical protein
MHEWRRDAPLGVLLDIINHIKTPKQHELFCELQAIVLTELPADATAEDRKILKPVKPVVTRWNSY